MERTKDFRKILLGGAAAIMLMCYMFVQLSLTSLAAEGKVTAQAAKIRASASTSSDQVGSAIRGEKYTITGEETGADGYVWYKITFDGNKTGYIRSDLMSKTEDTGSTGGTATLNPSVEVTDVQPVSAKITGSSVRVRSDASTSGSIIAGVVRDSVVTVVGQAKDSQGKTWYLVTYSAENGEIKGFIREDFMTVSGTITPITDTPPVNDPTVSDPGTTTPGTTEPTPSTPDTPSVVIHDFEVIEEEGVWKLVDNTAGKKYNAAALIKANEVNPPRIEELEAKVSSQKGWIIFLVILVVVLGVLVTLTFLKIKDVMDEAYFTAVEKETIRQRQGQKANNSAAKSKPVMQTVGANNGNRQSVPKPSVPKPNGTAGNKSVQQRPAGAAPQTVKVSNPADTRAPKPAPNGQQRPAQGGQQRPANAQNGQQRPVQGGQQRPVSSQGGQRPAGAPTGQQARPTQQRPADSASKQSWQSKNFVADEDEDFEFEFLNWDGNEEN